MSATITIQFVERATAHALSDSMASVELTMGSGDNGYGGSVGIVLRSPEEARLLLNAASEALGLLTTKDTTP